MVLRVLVIAVLAAWISTATANGRGGCRIEGPVFSLRCYAEQQLWRQGPLSWWAGIAATSSPLAMWPYTMATLDLGQWWVLAEVGSGQSVRWGLSIGIRW